MIHFALPPDRVLQLLPEVFPARLNHIPAVICGAARGSQPETLQREKHLIQTPKMPQLTPVSVILLLANLC